VMAMVHFLCRSERIVNGASPSPFPIVTLEGLIEE
jgi:hypothetical protein